MPPLAILAAIMGTPQPDASVLDVYRQACVDGEFQVTPERGTVFQGTRAPPGVSNTSEAPPYPTHTIYIEMKKPADTSILIERYDSPKARFESVCKVTSRHWVEKDARLAFIAGTTNPKVWDTRDGGHPYEPYVIDQPANGIRKRLFVHDPWVAVETAVYRDAR
jgi:hypothetical protein